MEKEIKPSLRSCLVCGLLTAGSIGTAGYAWTRICQPCKDKEDAAALENVKAMNNAFRKIFGAL